MTQPTQDVGPELQQDLAQSINRLFNQKLSKDSMEKLQGQYKIPINCRAMGVPKVNSEIWSLLPQRNRQNDYNQQVQQQSIALTSNIVARMAETIFSPSEPLPMTIRENLLRMALDAEKVLGSLTQDIAQKRRVDIKPVLNQDVAGICSATIAPGEWLFGDNIAEQLKNSRATANVIRSSLQTSRRNFRYSPFGQRGTFKSNLNWKTPSQRGGYNPQHRGGFSQQYRGNFSQQY